MILARLPVARDAMGSSESEEVIMNKNANEIFEKTEMILTKLPVARDAMGSSESE